MAWSEEREAELYGAGWSDAEVRDYRRAYESAARETAGAAQRSYPTSGAAPEMQDLAAARPVAGHGPRAARERDTWGGRLERLVPAGDEAAEAAAARQLADEHELIYGSRPGLAHCLQKVRGSGPRVVLAGDTADVVARIRYAFPDLPIRVVVGADPASAQIGGIVTAPASPPQMHGAPGITAGAISHLARRR